jgi:RNA polymerase sigma factor (sigma-70 family)
MTNDAPERSHVDAHHPEAEAAARDFEAHRPHLRGVAYRMLGSMTEADDAVQEAWIRLARSDTDEVRDLRAWLTTVVARISLDMLRTRGSRREDSLTVLPDPVVERATRQTPAPDDPEEQALLADSVGLAMLVVLDTLSPAERLAFVLHDVFGVPFEQIGSITDRTPGAAKQLASRARRRIRDASALPNASPARQREIIDAFLAAARDGDFEALVEMLDPNVVLRADGGADERLSQVVNGAVAVAGQAMRFQGVAQHAQPVMINGMPGLLAAPHGQPFALMSFAIRDDRIVEMDVFADPERLRRLGLDRIATES